VHCSILPMVVCLSQLLSYMPCKSSPLCLAVFSALRAYAISGCSLLLASAILSLSLVLVAGEIYEISTQVVVTVPEPVGCVIYSLKSTILVPCAV